jgi:hypothetical protein
VSGESTDPRRIRSLAVHRDDVLTALEARERGRKPTVLRVLPPFSGRMRARLHVATGEPDPDEIHVHPATFVADPPGFPHVDETEDRLRERGEYDLDRHREAYERAVARWRETVEERLRDRITLPTASAADDGPETTGADYDVTVSYLG